MTSQKWFEFIDNSYCSQVVFGVLVISQKPANIVVNMDVIVLNINVLLLERAHGSWQIKYIFYESRCYVQLASTTLMHYYYLLILWKDEKEYIVT